ncbi:unnamed protein product [Parascedosporium putredinis]|uniref:Uncharacterized protein n=1 Tax=Parascedosporium putredinis TaxID=1442378 RepID=A0A9P1GWS1_9PEZI|nr:unnamed protein product [Parascedosporium putredinis]CAI7989086.1 unnamed protein product [Parascedosporium putredinis]
MSGAFRPVNSSLQNTDAKTDMTSPTTPRPAGAPTLDQPRHVEDATTPTRASFKASLSAQKPLPSSPFPQAVQVPNSAPPGSQFHEREGSTQAKSEDIEMEGTSSGPTDPSMAGTESIEEEPCSDDEESVNADGSKSGKKKKSQRLDNLRQHAQTVHINEDIPIDSLAATGSRYQRQIRTDRVRPTGRARASTAGSVGGPIRGHSKSLSTSSITSMSSVGRRDSISTTASTTDDAWRRRTWHPDSRNFVPPTNTLNSVANSDNAQLNPPAPMTNGPPNRNSNIRLPGIESFDSVAHPVTPPRRPASPMMVDAEMVSPQHPDDERRNHSQWDMGLHRGLTRLDISKHNTPPNDSAGAWANETERAMQAQAEQARAHPPTVRFQVEPQPMAPLPPRAAPRGYHQHTLSAPSITTARESKRHGWYHGPMNTHSEAPELHAEPRQPRVDRMVHPNIAAFSGFPAREHPQPSQQNPQQNKPASPDSLRRLEALVAVATSEGKTAAAY